jgi:serine/threonine protein kinase
MPSSPLPPSLRELFDTAVVLPPPQRADFLAAHCSDVVLRGAVAQLLVADERDDAILRGSVSVIAASIGETEMAFVMAPGSLVGPYTLATVLGEGGSSTVFRASRESEGVRQDVALKILRRGLYSPDAQRQFRRERQALAQLQHAGIARLIDGGITDNGLAYIALELVEGKPITKYAREHRLDLRQRLRLFMQVCRVVEAAHRALIVHRDLKPSNVLVTADGQVKLLDFGIAKLLDGDDETQTQLPAFTPAYAAPEQYNGTLITTATDVYALGILLGELITGQRLSGSTDRTPSSQIKHDDHPGILPASAHITRRSLRGDLANIVLKAINIEAERRYVSAGAFADDIDRLIDGRPVAAHPPSVWYRAKKFVARHRGGVATTLAFLLAIIAALALALWQTRIARHESARANTVRDFVESIFDPLQQGTPENKQPSLRELLASSVERLDQARKLGPSERVDLLLMFARLNNKVGEPGRGQALADRASTLAEAELGPNDPLTLDALVDRALDALYREDYTRAKPELEAAENRLLAAHIGGVRMQRLDDGLAKLVNEQGDPQRALGYVRAALDARIAAYGGESEKAGDGYYNLAYGLEAVGNFQEAADAYRHAHLIDVKNLPPDSFDLSQALAGQGAAEVYAGHFRNGRENLRNALAIADNVGGKPRETQVAYSEQLCFAELSMAPATASAACSKAMHMVEAVFGATSARYGLVLRLAAMLAIEHGDLVAARKMLEQSEARLKAGENIAWRGRSEITLGELDLIEGKNAEAMQLLANGIEHFGKSYPPHLRRHALALLALACVDGAAAICTSDLFARADAEIKAVSYRWNPLLLPAHIALAQSELASSHAPAAVERLQTAITQADAEVESTQPRLLEARIWLATAQAAAGHCEIAHSVARTTMSTLQQNHLVDHPLLVAALHAMADSRHCGVLSG